jgi:hypothetical protein
MLVRASGLGDAGFHRDHQLAQKRDQLLHLLRRQRGGDELLLLCQNTQRLHELLPAFRRELDEHAAAIAGIAAPPDEPYALKVVEAGRHRPARQLGAAGELSCGPAPRLRPAQSAQDLPVAERQAPFLEGLVEHLADPPIETVNAIDDPFDAEIDLRWKPRRDLLEPRVDVVTLGLLPGHVRSVDELSLDVKTSRLIACRQVV